jgi:hypothetical protein
VALTAAIRASIEGLDTDETFRVSLDIATGGAVDLTGGYDIAISTNGSFAPVADAPGQVSWAEQANRLQLVEMVARYYWGNEL